MDPVLAPPPCGLTEPVDRRVLALLRRAVLEHAVAEQRRVFPPAVHVGVPGSSTASLTLGDQLGDRRLDHALRTDAIEAMVRRTRGSAGPGTADPQPLVWLTRAGSLEVRDVDLAWLRAARSAAAELHVALPMVVVNRRGWLDPATGVGRDWKARVRSARVATGAQQSQGVP
ncbi:hypothetical protein [Nocardioides sp.]|uniref:hypothetical protein n=1 Tax=Nocardioides sp. TaxID=35761 RepID=UPI0027198B8C|nr:hypothetical protein [Nocardioides sp.]MDO9456036.1 hypothetical protein [Nocardioides sp.]